MESNDMIAIKKEDIETFILNYEGDKDVTNIHSHIMGIYLDITNVEEYVLLTLIKDIIHKNSISRVPKNIGCISVESPVRRQKGQILTIEYLQELYDFAKENNIKLHLDAARLYMMTSASKIPIHEYTKYFDTVYCSLWKYFGAPWGAILAGDSKLISNMFNTRRMFGGSIPNSSLNAALILSNLEGFEDKMNGENSHSFWNSKA